MIDFDLEWARCSHWIKQALEYAPTHTLADVKAEIELGEAQFWVGRHCALVTQILPYPRTKVCTFWLAGGDLDELVNVWRPRIEQWAASQGCDHMITPGRFGWQKVLKPMGYQPLWAIISKELRP